MNYKNKNISGFSANGPAPHAHKRIAAPHIYTRIDLESCNVVMVEEPVSINIMHRMDGFTFSLL